jgi:hypothetical protein
LTKKLHFATQNVSKSVGDKVIDVYPYLALLFGDSYGGLHPPEADSWQRRVRDFYENRFTELVTYDDGAESLFGYQGVEDTVQVASLAGLEVDLPRSRRHSSYAASRSLTNIISNSTGLT